MTSPRAALALVAGAFLGIACHRDSPRAQVGADPYIGDAGQTSAQERDAAVITIPGESADGAVVCEPSGPTCSLGESLDALFPSTMDTVDCGTLELNEQELDVEQLSAMRSCVLAAVEAGKPFRFVQFLDGLDAVSGQAYVSQGAAHDIHHLYYDSGLFGECEGSGFVNDATCRALATVDDCDLTATPLCFECAEPGSARRVCEEG